MVLNRTSLFSALLILLLAMTGLYLNSQRGLLADDDNLWLHFTSQKIAEPVRGQALEDNTIQYVQTQQASDASILRLTERSKYLYNYALPVLAWHQLGTLVTTPQTTADYPAYIATFLNLALPVTSLAAWLVLVAVLLRLNEPALWRATLAGLGLIAALMLLPNNPPMMNLLGFNNPIHALSNFASFVLNPWHGFSVYSFTPRNNLIVLVIAVFALRWYGRNRAAYLLMLPLFGVHSSLSLVVMVHLVALDLLRQRHKLRDPVILAAIAAGMGYGLWRETLWALVGSSSLVMAALGGLILAFAWAIWAPRPLLGAEKWLTRPQTWLQRQPAAAQDVLLLMAFWLVSLPPVYIISLFMDPQQNFYFWHQLHGRALGVMGAVIFIGLAYYLPSNWSLRFSMFTLLIWAIGFTVHAASKPPPYATALVQAEMHEAYLSGQIGTEDYKYLSGPGFVLSEQTIYYALGQMMVMHNDRQPDLQRVAIPGGR